MEIVDEPAAASNALERNLEGLLGCRRITTVQSMPHAKGNPSHHSSKKGDTLKMMFLFSNILTQSSSKQVECVRMIIENTCLR